MDEHFWHFSKLIKIYPKMPSGVEVVLAQYKNTTQANNGIILKCVSRQRAEKEGQKGWDWTN